jgi:hypothetical protein
LCCLSRAEATAHVRARNRLLRVERRVERPLRVAVVEIDLLQDVVIGGSGRADHEHLRAGAWKVVRVRCDGDRVLRRRRILKRRACRRDDDGYRDPAFTHDMRIAARARPVNSPSAWERGLHDVDHCPRSARALASCAASFASEASIANSCIATARQSASR